MIERTMYVKDCFSGNKVGVITIIYDGNRFGVGVSMCKVDEDKFDKVIGKELAMSRAKECLTKTPMLLKDLTSVGSLFRLSKLSGCGLPTTINVDCDTYDREEALIDTYNYAVKDMIYTLALRYVQSDCSCERSSN